jgi:hypothetical protein
LLLDGSIYKSFDIQLLIKKIIRKNGHQQSLTLAREKFTTIENLELAVSAARSQHGSQVCFATFIWQKITKLQITQQLHKLEKK